MKKLLTLLFTALMAVSLALPVFAQDAGTASQDQSSAPKKQKKAKKSKKSKKSSDSGAEAPKQ
jgi:hypothetical protein